MKKIQENEPAVIRSSPLSVQVCVPKDWTDKKVKTFADSRYPCGTTHGWLIRKEGDSQLGKDPERNPCSGRKQRKDFVHIVLDA